ncbi:MAG: hypothetical protein MJ237_00615 [bacterium]|nr:hypothetical protein [bacterium]
MIKKLIIIVICIVFGSSIQSVASTDKLSEDYLKSHKHFSIMNPVAESVASGVIKSAIKREAKGKYKVKLSGYTLNSLKNGVFKSLLIEGKEIDAAGIEIPYAKITTVTDYNRIDYSHDPVTFLSDIVLDYNIHLSENTLNQALSTKDYKELIDKVNGISYPLVIVKKVSVSIKNNRVKLSIAYNFPLKPASSDKIYSFSSGVNVYNGKLRLSPNHGNSVKSTMASSVMNIINMLDPLVFTTNLLEEKKCNGKVENVKIVDNIIQINGRIYIEADQKLQ